MKTEHFIQILIPYFFSWRILMLINRATRAQKCQIMDVTQIYFTKVADKTFLDIHSFQISSASQNNSQLKCAIGYRNEINLVEFETLFENDST